MEPTQCSETSVFNTQTPGKYPEDNLSNLRDFVYWRARVLEENEQNRWHFSESWVQKNENKLKINLKKKLWKKKRGKICSFVKTYTNFESVNNDDVTRVDRARRTAGGNRSTRSCEIFWRQPFRRQL
jgi:hypothetical protein